MKISEDIMNRIKSVGRGNYFTADDFADIASPDTIRQNLSRLAKTGFLVRVANGFFHYPETLPESDIRKPVQPSTYMYEYAKKYKFDVVEIDTRIFDTLRAKNPYEGQTIFLTNGKSRVLRFEDTYDIRLVKTTNASYFQFESNLTASLLYVVSLIGKDKLTRKQKETIRLIFYTTISPSRKFYTDFSTFLHARQLLPTWFRKIL